MASTEQDENVLEEIDLGDECLPGDMEGAAEHFIAALTQGNGQLCDRERAQSGLEPLLPPHYAGCAHNMLGKVQHMLAMRTGLFEEAVASFRSACICVPDQPDVLNQLGVTLYLQGEFQQSCAAYDQCVALLQRLQADDSQAAGGPEGVADVIVALATSARFAADTEEEGLQAAILQYDRALEVDPSHDQAFTERAALLSNVRYARVCTRARKGVCARARRVACDRERQRERET